MNFSGYSTGDFYDELFHDDGSPREVIKTLIDQIDSLPSGDLVRRQKAAESKLLQMGITFNVYGDSGGTEKIFPFDIIPRVIQAREWESLKKGLQQRIYALNLFINDVYNEGKIIKDKVIPLELLKTSACYQKHCEGLHPPKDIWIHITGTDLIRDKDGKFYILEDNLRCPSGVSYVLENRFVLKQTFPRAFKAMDVSPVDDYPERLRDALNFISSKEVGTSTNVILTPGMYNSAYFEHSYLAQQMGVQLVEGRDLVVQDGQVWMRTTKGFDKVDVIYRRVDDDFLDPKVFKKDSLLGVPGLMEVYKQGKVALANAPGAGIADDKAVYAYTPEIIKYYLGEEPITPIIPTYICSNEKDRKHVLQNLDSLVVKAVNQSGGYGMLIGPQSTKKEQQEFSELITKNPRDYIAQPTMPLSRAPTIIENTIEGRHVDFRPYALYGKDIYVIPGGLTRVALRKGSLVVNSSQGGGSKDTWVLSGQGEGSNA